MNLTIGTDTCMICGKKLDKEDIIKAHLIPKMLKPKDNIFTYFHKECEDKLNKLYICQQKVIPTKRIVNIMENAIVGLANKIEELKDESSIN
jgi:methionyl-tRNA synthetase